MGVEGAVGQVYRARQDEFNKRVQVFNQSQSPDAGKFDEVDIEEFIRSRGLSPYECDLMDIANSIKKVKEAGIQRSQATQFVNHALKSAWGSAREFAPEARRLVFDQKT